MGSIQDLLESATIIAAIRQESALSEALKSNCQVIFLLSSSLDTIGEHVKHIHEADKLIFVHFDLMDGLRRDRVALQYLVNKYHIDGILTTHSSVVRMARDLGVPCIQRLFLIDSVSIDTGIQSINKLSPDAIEVMPGTIPKAIQALCMKVKIPIIAGGLISNKEEIIASLGAGAVSVSTSRPELWDL